MFSSVSNVLSIKKGEWESRREKDMKKAPSRNKLMNKWLTGISKRCRLPQDIDMENKKHVLGGERWWIRKKSLKRFLMYLRKKGQKSSSLSLRLLCKRRRKTGKWYRHNRGIFRERKPSWPCENRKRVIWNSGNTRGFVDWKIYQSISDWFNKEGNGVNLLMSREGYSHVKK